MDIRPVAAILTGRLLDQAARAVHPRRDKKGGAFLRQTSMLCPERSRTSTCRESMDAKVVLQ